MGSTVNPHLKTNSDRHSVAIFKKVSQVLLQWIIWEVVHGNYSENGKHWKVIGWAIRLSRSINGLACEATGFSTSHENPHRMLAGAKHQWFEALQDGFSHDFVMPQPCISSCLAKVQQLETQAYYFCWSKIKDTDSWIWTFLMETSIQGITH